MLTAIKKFMKPPHADAYNPEIQTLRAIALIAILIHHLGGLFIWHSASLTEFGMGLSVGVDLFFCISGYVIAKSLLPRLRNKEGIVFWQEVGAFWIRRFYRIAPSAWLWILLPMLLAPFFIHVYAAQLTDNNLADAAAAVFHVENLHYYDCGIGEGKCGDFALYWSLSLEEQFYIALPFVVLLARKRLVPVLVILILAQAFIHRQEWAGILWFIRTDAILFGVLIAIFSETQEYKILEPKLNSSLLRFVIPPLLLFGLIATTRYQIVTFYTGLAAAICAVIVWLCSYNKGYFLAPSFIRNIFVWLGARSYALYLIHIPVYWATREIWIWIEPEGKIIGAKFTARFALTALFLALSMAEINYRLIEEPLRKRGKIHAKNLLSRNVPEREPISAKVRQETT